MKYFLLSLTIAASLQCSLLFASEKSNPHEKLTQVVPFITCLDCHEKTALDLADSVHFRFKRGKNGEAKGVLTEYSPYSGGFASANWLYQLKSGDKVQGYAGCAFCHPGNGKLPGEKLSTGDIRKIDCFICHGENYVRSVAESADGGRDLTPDSSQNFIEISKKLGKPKPAQCQRCHAPKGEGNRREGIVPTEASDIHFSMGMICTECHLTFNHRITGAGDLKAVEISPKPVVCPNCHTYEPHKAENGDEVSTRNAIVFNSHVQKIACQTCHIPAVGRDPEYSVLIERDWTKPVRDKQTGLYLPTDKRGVGIRADYFWWDGTFNADGTPKGVPRDGKSKIYPWKKSTYTVAADAISGKLLNLDRAVYAETGDISLAVKEGAKKAGQSYSGKWKTEVVTEYVMLNHQIAPKEKALRCISCHDPHGVLDFRKLKGKRR